MKTFVLACVMLGTIGVFEAEAGCGQRLSGSCGSSRAKVFEGRTRGGLSCGKTRTSSCAAAPKASACTACDKANEKAAPAAAAPKSDKK